MCPVSPVGRMQSSEKQWMDPNITINNSPGDSASSFYSAKLGGVSCKS